MTLTKEQNKIIVDALALRKKSFSVSQKIGAQFAIALSDGWKRNGIDGIRAACFELSELVKDTPGAWDVYSKAWRLGY